MRTSFVTGLFLAAACCVNPAWGVLFGVGWSDDSSPVYRVDETTGSVIQLGLSGFAHLNSLAADAQGTLYSVGHGAGVSIDDPSGTLVTINPVTGQGTAVVNLNFGAGTLISVRSMAFSPTGVLYAVNSPALQGEPQDLYRVDPVTGVGTLVGGLGIGVQGLDFAADGTLYGWGVVSSNPWGLYTINPDTAAVTKISGATSSSYAMQSLVFTPDGTLYAYGMPLTNPSETGLYTVDPASGNLSPVGSPSFFDIRGLEVPEPAIVGPLALLFLGGRRRGGHVDAR